MIFRVLNLSLAAQIFEISLTHIHIFILVLKVYSKGIWQLQVGLSSAPVYLSLSRVRILFNPQFFKAFISQLLKVAYITASGMISHVINLGRSYADFSLETFRFEDVDDYEIWLEVFSRLLKI